MRSYIPSTVLTEFEIHKGLFQKAVSAPQNPRSSEPSDGSPDLMAWADNTTGGRNKWEPIISRLRSQYWIMTLFNRLKIPSFNGAFVASLRYLGRGLVIGSFLVYGIPQAIIVGVPSYLIIRQMSLTQDIHFRRPLDSYQDTMKAELLKMEPSTPPLKELKVESDGALGSAV